MGEREQERLKMWVETWKQAGPKLEAIRCQSLRSFRYQDHAAEIDELLEIACRFAQPRFSSGLVEQQRFFQKAKHLFRKDD